MFEGSKELNGSLAAKSKDIATLAAGAKQVADGNAKVNEGWKTAVDGSGQLASGSKQVADGSKELNSSLAAKSGEIQTLADGARQVADGNGTVKTGWTTMTDGVQQLDDGVGQVKDGTQELAKGLDDGAKQVAATNRGDENKSQFANPVQLAGEKINDYPFYRYANAPYILSLALFVGALLMVMAVGVRRPAGTEISPLAWYVRRYGFLALLVAGQAILLTVFTSFYVHSGFLNTVSMIPYAILASLTFMTIVFFLVMLLGKIGLLIGAAFLIVQLSTTGSALPVDMLPEYLRNISQFLPMSYSIAGFRSLISLDDFGGMLANGGILLIFLVLFAGLAAAVSYFKKDREVEDSDMAA